MPPVERCARCGTPRRGDLQVCVQCEAPFEAAGEDVDLALPRPAAPSPTQTHGTVMAAVLLGFVGLAFLLWLSVRGVGPFPASVVEVARVGETRVRVTVQVTNDGTKAGHGKCRIERLTETGNQEEPFQFLSQRVRPKETVTQTVEFDLHARSSAGAVAC
ncbi:MAG TPA: hypothetical protein VNA20_02455 [Frankiaceae bacterium]|nr:hypothetical protein [Frankiaceae bacterium]